MAFSLKRKSISADGTLAGEEPPKIAKPAKPGKRKKRRRIITAAVVILVVLAAVWYVRSRLPLRLMPDMSSQYTIAKAGYMDITESLSGSGALNPADSYTVSTLISGDIISAPFEEGDIISKDSILYEFDSSKVASNIETAEISLAESKKAYEQKLKSADDLVIRAARSGTIVSLDIKVGDSVQAGQLIGTIRNSSVMSLTLPFGSDDASGLYIGQQVSVTLDSSFETLTGTITKIGGIDEALAGGIIVRQVTIEVNNPGGIHNGQRATAMAGDIACYGSGTFTYKAEANITAKASGDVLSVEFSEGDFVNQDEIIATLDSSVFTLDITNAQNSIRRAEIALESQYDTLDGYTIRSPIGGTVIEKKYKAGDTLESGAILCTIFDLSYLTMTLNIDELDISDISVGQKVKITAQAVEGKEYTGVITRININGITAGGTTSYPVTIRIDETEGLLPGMNVDAVIVIESHENVLAIPVGAVTRGNQVLVRSADGSTAPGAPEGFNYVTVKTGASNNNYIEILDGLKEGDEIAYLNHVYNTNMFGMMGGPVQGETVVVTQSESGGAPQPPAGGANRP